MNGALLFGRILMAAIFVFSGAVKFVDLSGTAGHIAEQGLPLPMLGTGLAGAFEVAAGLAIAAGFHTRWAALALAAWCVVTAVIFHDWWTITDRHEQVDQMLHMFKNAAMAGGFIVLAMQGPGLLSIDARRARAY